jgi:hypothetical protein
MRWPRNLIRYWWIVALLIATVLLAQFGLQLIVRHYANSALNGFPGLSGKIGSVSLNFIPGEYLLKNVTLHYAEGDQREYLSFEELGVRVYWESLISGTFEGYGWLKSPKLTIWAPSHKKKAKGKPKKKADWQSQIRGLVPIKITKFDIQKGIIQFRDPTSKPPIDLKMENIDIEARNLTNREELKDAMFAKATMHAKAFGSGRAELSMLFDPLAKYPTFKLKSALRNVDLTHLNQLLLAYGKFDVDKGQFSLFNEIAAKDGSFIAYAKPMFRHIDVRAWEAKHHPNHKLLVLWRNIVGDIVDFLKNKEEDQLALEIKADGSFDDPDIHIWQAVGSLLYNGFIQALIPGYDNSISWTDVPVDKH